MALRLRRLTLTATFAIVAAYWAASCAALDLDIGVYRPSDGTLYLDLNRDRAADRGIRFALPPEKVLVADMNGDGLADIVTYSGGTWTADYNLDGTADATWYFGGAPGDVPLVGDVDGDGRTDLIIYRAGTWFVSTHRDGVADRVFAFGGAPSDIPVLADLDCDGVMQPLLFHDGTWSLYAGPSQTPVVVAGLGAPGDRPFAIDWDGDCHDDLGVFRDGRWYVLRGVTDFPVMSFASLGGAGDAPVAGRMQRGLQSAKYRQTQTHYALYRSAERSMLMRFASEDGPDLVLDTGLSGTPVAADFNGDRSTDVAVYANGRWQVDLDLDGRPDLTYDFGGVAGDVPLAADVDGDGAVDLVIYRDGMWYVSTARTGAVSLMHGFGGIPGDQPLLADMNGDGRADFGIYRGGLWYFDTDRDGRPDLVYAFGGEPHDRALVGDWNEDGHPDLGIFRSGEWFVNTVPAAGVPTTRFVFGGIDDVALIGKFVLRTGAEPVLFAPFRRPTYSGDSLLSATVNDVNGDGWPDALEARNDTTGVLIDSNVENAGLGSIHSPNRINRDCRLADLNGDERLDVVCNTYSPLGNTESFARLFFAAANSAFVEDAAFAAMSIRGFGETIVAADFDNDGTVDLFVPFYSHNAPGEHSYLLHNDGSGHFTDIADAAGVALRGVPLDHRVEGAQGVDYDGDGWIDLYVGGRLFHNNGNLTFTDVTSAVGLPGTFDEGAKFIDWNNDGRLDLVLHHPTSGPALWEFDGVRFRQRDVLPHYALLDAFGLNIGDLNGDGREDIVMPGGTAGAPAILLNTGARFERNPVSLLDSLPFGLSSIADFDRDGRLDMYLTDGYGMRIQARNISPNATRPMLTLDIVDAAGRHNQFGRVVRVQPQSAPAVTMTRVVDGGSGFLSQTPYAITMPTPYLGGHQVSVRFAARTVTFTMLAGQRIRVYADGRIQPY